MITDDVLVPTQTHIGELLTFTNTNKLRTTLAFQYRMMIILLHSQHVILAGELHQLH